MIKKINDNNNKNNKYEKRRYVDKYSEYISTVRLLLIDKDRIYIYNVYSFQLYSLTKYLIT